MFPPKKYQLAPFSLPDIRLEEQRLGQCILSVHFPVFPSVRYLNAANNIPATTRPMHQTNILF